MKKVIFKECIFNVDYDATLEHYSKLNIGHAEACGCEDCIRFATFRDKIYCFESIQLLDQFGIDFRKEENLTFGGEFEPNKFFYHCDFGFYGGVESSNCLALAPPKIGGFEFTPICENISIRFHPNRDNDFVQVDLFFQNISL